MSFIATRKADRFWRIRGLGDTYETWSGTNGNKGTVHVTYLKDGQDLEQEVARALRKAMAKGYERCESEDSCEAPEAVVATARANAAKRRLPAYAGYDRLERALFDGKIDRLKSLFASGISPDVRDFFYGTRMFRHVILTQPVAAVQAFLDAGASVGSVMGDTPPLHAAVRREGRTQSKVVRLLLEAGADPNERLSKEDWEQGVHGCLESYQKPCLHHGVSGLGQSSPETVRLIVAAGYDLNARDVDGRTALHAAVDDWEGEMAKLLIELGVDVDVEDNLGRTAYDLCRVLLAQMPEHEIAPATMQWIAEAGGRTHSGNAELDLLRQLLEPLDKPGVSYAAIQMVMGVARARRRTGAATEELGFETQPVPLKSVTTVLRDIGLAIEASLSEEPLPSLQTKEEEERRLADIGAAFLIGKGVGAPYEKLIIGDVPILMYAAKVGLPRVTRALLEHGIDVREPVTRHGTPHAYLSRAVTSGHLDVARILLEAGADPNSQGGAPMYGAADYANLEMAKLLVSYGGDPKKLFHAHTGNYGNGPEKKEAFRSYALGLTRDAVRTSKKKGVRFKKFKRPFSPSSFGAKDAMEHVPTSVVWAIATPVEDVLSLIAEHMPAPVETNDALAEALPTAGEAAFFYQLTDSPYTWCTPKGCSSRLRDLDKALAAAVGTSVFTFYPGAYGGGALEVISADGSRTPPMGLLDEIDAVCKEHGLWVPRCEVESNEAQWLLFRGITKEHVAAVHRVVWAW